MKQIDLNRKFIDFDGSELNDSMAKVLAARLFQANSGDALKYFEWSQNLYKEGIVQLDSSDLETFTRFVKDCQLPVGLKAQLLKTINEYSSNS